MFMTRRFLLLVSMLFLNSLQSAPGATDDQIDGIARYNKGDIAGAITALSRVAASKNNSATVQYYLANAHLRLGNRTQALSHYQAALALQPSPALAAYCQKALHDYGAAAPASATTFGAQASQRGYLGIVVANNVVTRVFIDSPAAKAGLQALDRVTAVDATPVDDLKTDRTLQMLKGDVGSSVKLTVDRSGKRLDITVVRAQPAADQQAEISPTGRARQPRMAAAAADDIDKRMIIIHRHTADTDDVYSQVTGALSLISRQIKEELFNFGIRIVIAPTIAEANPDSSQNKPRGYIHGGGMDNVPGMYMPWNKQIFVGERASWKNSPPQRNRWVQSTMLHETGHAFDDSHYHLSTAGDFKAAYDEDFQRLTNSQRTRLYYYCQEGDAGPSELFAELFALTESSAGGIDPRSPELVSAFPNSLKFVRTLLDK